MDTQLPPPIQKQKTFYHHAATYCLLAPFVGIGVSFVINVIHASNTSTPTTRIESLITALFLLIIIVSGVLFGVISLFGIRQHGKAGILWKAITGILIVAFLFLAAIPSFLHARKMAQARQEQQSQPAVTMEQSEHLFKITLPPGWLWDEQMGNIKITDPQTRNSISIQFRKSAKYSTEEEKQLLEKGNQAMIDRFVKPQGGTTIKDEETFLNGVYARQLTWTVTHNGRMGNVTYLSLIYKEHAFTITFGSPDDNQVQEMKKSVETLQFE